MGKINVLSLFDGISCGHIALDKAGIPINKYYASEIDKYAIKVTNKNYPETINLYLCKVAMDIMAKHAYPDENGVRIAFLDEMTYRKYLWDHRPLTDFWRVGHGYAKKLQEAGLYTMGDIARCSIGKPGEFHNEELLLLRFVSPI